jgi:hypothetical protein
LSQATASTPPQAGSAGDCRLGTPPSSQQGAWAGEVQPSLRRTLTPPPPHPSTCFPPPPPPPAGCQLSDRPVLCCDVDWAAGQAAVGCSDHAVYAVDLSQPPGGAPTKRRTLYTKTHGHCEWVPSTAPSSRPPAWKLPPAGLRARGCAQTVPGPRAGRACRRPPNALLPARPPTCRPAVRVQVGHLRHLPARRQNPVGRHGQPPLAVAGGRDAGQRAGRPLGTRLTGQLRHSDDGCHPPPPPRPPRATPQTCV